MIITHLLFIQSFTIGDGQCRLPNILKNFTTYKIGIEYTLPTGGNKTHDVSDDQVLIEVNKNIFGLLSRHIMNMMK